MQTPQERAKEFAELIGAIADQPDGQAKLEYIEMLLTDPEALDFAFAIINPFLETGGESYAV